MGKTRMWSFVIGGMFGFLMLAALSVSTVSGASKISGQVRVQMEVTASLAMQIVSPNDADATCPDDGTSCASLLMEPHEYSSSYSDITVMTNNSAGYGLTVQAANPDLVSTSDSSNIVPAGVIEERGGTPYGDQNAWSYKTDGTIVTNWTAMRTTPQTIRSVNEATLTGDTTRVTYGVSTGTNPTGAYRTTLTYTATMFDDQHGPEPEPRYMQGFTCGSIARGETVTLTDRRDGKSYAVSRLVDGLCWMSEDLKLGGNADIQITPTYSDVSTTFTLKAENTGAWCTDNTAACINQSLMRKTGGEGSNYAPTYLYNWYAMTAGGGYETTSGMIESSICPKGWKPPHGGTGIGSFASITSTYDTTAKLTTQPVPGFNLTGFRTGATVNYPSTGGYYWSRTAVNAGNANYLVFYSNTVKPANVGSKYFGFAVRCVSTL